MADGVDMRNEFEQQIKLEYPLVNHGSSELIDQNSPGSQCEEWSVTCLHCH